MAMLNALRRLVSAPFRRSLDAAGGGRRWQAAGTTANPNAEILGGAAIVRNRARYAVGSNPHAAAGVRSYAANLIGTGIRPSSQHPDPARRATLQRLFERLSIVIDADERTDLYGLMLAATIAMIVDGESLIRMEVTPDGQLRLRLLPAEMLDNGLTRELPGGGRIVAGIEFDASGRRVAYHLWSQRPGEPLATSFTTIRVPAADVIHLFRPDLPGQVRGLSWLAPVLLRLKELDEFFDAQLVRQKVAALFAGFIVDAEGSSADFRGKIDVMGALAAGMEPGTLKVLPPGTDVRFSEPANIGDTEWFIKNTLRAIAAGLGITYEQLTGDLSGVNYSSIRAGLVEFRRKVETVQFGIIVPQLCRPVWNRFVRLAVLRGELPAAAFYERPDDFLACDWIPPANDWVDPKNDVEADALAVDRGFKSRREVVQARGYDIEALDAEIVADKKRTDALGLDFSATPTPAPQPKEPANAA